jgi:SAM-dependent methyltransferase
MSLNEQVRAYWEAEPCGTATFVVGDASAGTPEWFHRIEDLRYAREPEIHSVAQFTRHYGKRILEIGVGAGTDHLQWARAGAECYGVDLTDAALEVTHQRLSLHGFSSNLQQCDAETLPFPDASFDVVYSWGVIHHSEHPHRIVEQIHRVLKPGGVFLGMIYGRYSSVALKLWVGRALLKGKPWYSLSRVISENMESVGTKAYTPREAKHLFGAFADVHAQPMITYYDKLRWPAWIAELLPDRSGWFITLRAVK